MYAVLISCVYSRLCKSTCLTLCVCVCESVCLYIQSCVGVVWSGGGERSVNNLRPCLAFYVELVVMGQSGWGWGRSAGPDLRF